LSDRRHRFLLKSSPAWEKSLSTGALDGNVVFYCTKTLLMAGNTSKASSSVSEWRNLSISSFEEERTFLDEKKDAILSFDLNDLVRRIL